VEALWQGVADGAVNSVGTDHVPIKLQGKEGTVWAPSSGGPGTHLLLPSLLSEGYHRRGVPLERIAELVCTNPAKLYGLYPRKGVIAVGADADLTIVDLEAERMVRAADFPSNGDFSLFEGMLFKGWPTHAIVRGRTVMAEGKLQGASGWGRYQHR
jgi:dihydropyrimidinase